MLRIKVHRGTKEIGGSITEIYTEKTHIFVDFGTELNTDPEASTDPKMIDMINNAKCDAVLFTHYHGDHIGLLEHIPKKDIDGKTIKLAMGKVAKKVLINIHKTLAGYNDSSQNHKKYLEILNDKERIQDIDEAKPLYFGVDKDIKVTPIRVDHSAYDAFMFIIEAEGKVVVHTGDFRTHGRWGKGYFEQLLKTLSNISVDILIIEGTMMSRLYEKMKTERELQEEARKELAKPENKYAFLICSSTNVESLASFANAARDLKRAFYVNSYVYEQIELYRSTVGEDYLKRNDLYTGKNDERAFMFDKTYKFENMEKYNPKLNSTQPEYMRENGFLMLIGSSDKYKERMDYFKGENPLLIYSMWNGYIRKGEDTYNEKLGKLYHGWNPDRRNAKLHTSGHATAKDIQNMILTVKPQQAIIPIHTEKPEEFRKLDIGEYADIILEKLVDGEVVEVK